MQQKNDPFSWKKITATVLYFALIFAALYCHLLTAQTAAGFFIAVTVAYVVAIAAFYKVDLAKIASSPAVVNVENILAAMLVPFLQSIQDKSKINAPDIVAKKAAEIVQDVLKQAAAGDSPFPTPPVSQPDGQSKSEETPGG